MDNSGRQYPLYAEAKLTGAAVDAGERIALQLPGGARVISAELIVDTAFKTGAKVSVGDSGAAGRYGAGQALDAAGRIALTPTGYVYQQTDYVVATVSGSDDGIGSARLGVLYVVENRSNETQG